MSHLSALLQARLPATMTIPEELERSWQWMEDQGWGATGASGHYFLTPYAGDRQLGPVFSADETLTGWFEPGAPGFDRLLPIAEIDGSGSMAALWLDDTDQLRFVALESEGEKYVLADTALDFLRLVAIGYLELAPSFMIGGEPEDEDSVEALIPFRQWLETTFQVTVPGDWTIQNEPFQSWVDARLAEAVASRGGRD